jgi:FtsZ-binding cell division protein ZapB
MEQQNEVEYFKILEEKVGLLIAQIRLLRDERESLREKISQQEKSIADFAGEVERLKDNRDKVRDRIINILKKIEQIDI